MCILFYLELTIMRCLRSLKLYLECPLEQITIPLPTSHHPPSLWQRPLPGLNLRRNGWTDLSTYFLAFTLTDLDYFCRVAEDQREEPTLSCKVSSLPNFCTMLTYCAYYIAGIMKGVHISVFQVFHCLQLREAESWAQCQNPFWSWSRSTQKHHQKMPLQIKVLLLPSTHHPLWSPQPWT